MEYETVFRFLQEVGFPIFVCLWFMFRTEKVINRNTQIVRELVLILQKK